MMSIAGTSTVPPGRQNFAWISTSLLCAISILAMAIASSSGHSNTPSVARILKPLFLLDRREGWGMGGQGKNGGRGRRTERIAITHHPLLLTPLCLFPFAFILSIPDVCRYWGLVPGQNAHGGCPDASPAVRSTTAWEHPPSTDAVLEWRRAGVAAVSWRGW